METTVLEAALSQGIWAVVAVFLLIYTIKSNDKQNTRQEEREVKYQNLLTELSEKFSILNEIQIEISAIKDNILNKEKTNGV